MLFFNRFRHALGHTAVKKPSIGAVLDAAFAHQVCVEILFINRNRQLDNVYCRIRKMRRSSVLLVCSVNFLPDALNGEQCLIHFNLPRALLVHTFKMSAVEARQGFLCKTHIIHNHVDPESRQCEIEISRPEAYVQRELRKHERIFPSAGMVRSVDLWLRGRLPAHWRDLGAPDFTFREDSSGQLRLVNISAGGARLEMGDVEEADRYHRLSGTQMLLCVVLNRPGRKRCVAPVVCQCVEGLYSATMRRLALRLRFIQVWLTDSDGQGAWARVGDEGVQSINDWIANDYSLLAEKPAHLP